MASAAPRGLKVPESCGFPGDTTILWRVSFGFLGAPPQKGGKSQGVPRGQAVEDGGEQEVAERAAAFAVSRAVPLGGPLPLREGAASRRALGPAHGTDRR